MGITACTVLQSLYSTSITLRQLWAFFLYTVSDRLKFSQEYIQQRAVQILQNLSAYKIQVYYYDPMFPKAPTGPQYM